LKEIESDEKGFDDDEEEEEVTKSSRKRSGMVRDEMEESGSRNKRRRGGWKDDGDDYEEDEDEEEGGDTEDATSKEKEIKVVLRKVKKQDVIQKVGSAILAKMRKLNRMNRPLNGVFEADPSSLPGYIDVIKKPMYYAKISEKLKSKSYRSLETFYNDINLIFANAMAYNQDDTPVYKYSLKMCTEGGVAKAVEEVLQKEKIM